MPLLSCRLYMCNSGSRITGTSNRWIPDWGAGIFPAIIVQDFRVSTFLISHEENWDNENLLQLNECTVCGKRDLDQEVELDELVLHGLCHELGP